MGVFCVSMKCKNNQLLSMVNKTMDTLQFKQETYTVNEGQSFAIAVSREGDGVGTVSVKVLLRSNSARTGKDIDRFSETLTWADGDTSDKTLTIGTRFDDEEESVEDAILGLMAIQNAQYGFPRNARLVITNVSNTVTSIEDDAIIPFSKDGDRQSITFADFKTALGKMPGETPELAVVNGIADTDSVVIQRGNENALVSFSNLKSGLSEFSTVENVVNQTDSIALKNGSNGKVVPLSIFKESLSIPSFSGVFTTLANTDTIFVQKGFDKGAISLTDFKTLLGNSNSSASPFTTVHRVREMSGYVQEGFYFIGFNPIVGSLKGWVLSCNSGSFEAALCEDGNPISSYKVFNSSTNGHAPVISTINRSYTTKYSKKIQLHVANVGMGITDLIVHLDWAPS